MKINAHFKIIKSIDDIYTNGMEFNHVIDIRYPIIYDEFLRLLESDLEDKIADKTDLHFIHRSTYLILNKSDICDNLKLVSEIYNNNSLDYNDIEVRCTNEDAFEFSWNLSNSYDCIHVYIKFNLNKNICEFILDDEDYPQIKIGESHLDNNDKIIEELKRSVIGYLIGIGKITLKTEIES